MIHEHLGELRVLGESGRVVHLVVVLEVLDDHDVPEAVVGEHEVEGDGVGGGGEELAALGNGAVERQLLLGLLLGPWKSL